MASLLLISISFILLALSALCSPTEGAHYNYLHKRHSPRVSSEFDIEEREQIYDAITDAYHLALHALKKITPGTNVYDPTIFNHWFPLSDLDVVRNVLHNILGPKGSDFLQQITIRPDYHIPGEGIACDNITDDRAVTIHFQTPEIILCPLAFWYPGINKGYSRGPPVTCDRVGDRVSTKMDTLGATLLHEYLHMKPLVDPPLESGSWAAGAHDINYGAFSCRKLRDESPDVTKLNADSYPWYATEAFWTDECGKRFKPPTEQSSMDPICGCRVCRR